jgi:hypothetical protein
VPLGAGGSVEVDAMRPTLVLPIAMIVAAALVACTARDRARQEGAAEPVAMAS